MTKQNSQVKGRAAPRRRRRLDRWTVGALIIALVVLGPILSVVWIALHPSENIWPHLMASVLPRYLGNTLILMVGVAALTALFGVVCAWLVTMYRFPGRRWLSYALLFPLAIPAYVGAYALVDFLDYAGPLQSAMRGMFGWQDTRDYWFPEVRSHGPAIIVLASALYPYVYLLARAAFREQSGSAFEVARSLGAGHWALFWRLGLPLVRPAVAAGLALVLMETVADYGTVLHFGVQTLTTGVFSTWLSGNNAGGAAQIAVVILMLILLLVTLERYGRRKARFHAVNRALRPIAPVVLHGVRGWAATGFCLLPFAMGFVLPVTVMSGHAIRRPEVWTAPGLLPAFGNTVFVAGIAAILTVLAATYLVYGTRLMGRTVARIALPLTTLGYAAPGAVLALGLLIPLAALDHGIADGVVWLTGWDPGLTLTGTSAAIILAYFVRFFGVAEGALDAAFGRISPNLPMAARSLGRGAGGTLRDIYLPLMKGSVATALLVVFVDCVKELPATLLLRPFNFNTLSTRTFELASLERLGEAAPAALLVMLVGLAAVGILAHTNRE